MHGAQFNHAGRNEQSRARLMHSQNLQRADDALWIGAVGIIDDGYSGCGRFEDEAAFSGL